MWWFLKEGIKYYRKCRGTYICYSIYWGYVWTVGFICYGLGSKEPKKELEDFKYKRYEMYKILMWGKKMLSTLNWLRNLWLIEDSI